MRGGCSFIAVFIALCFGSNRAQLVAWGPETAWTQSSWPSVRVEFPYKHVLGGDLETIDAYQSSVGPQSINYYETKKQQSTSLPDDVVAWTLLKCSVCGVLTASGWENLRHDIHQTGYSVSYEDVLSVLSSACDSQVPAFSKAYSAKHSNKGLSKFQPYTPQICQRMLQIPSGFAKNPLIADIKLGLQSYTAQVNYKTAPNRQILSNRIPQTGSCEDFHPKCPQWAKMGECHKNPSYMMGSEPYGYCHFSCGTCLARNSEGKLPSMASGVAISVNIQKSIQSLACRELRVCEGVDPNLIPQAVPITIGKEELERESNVLRNLLKGTGKAGEELLKLVNSEKNRLSSSSIQNLIEREGKFNPKHCFRRAMGWWSYEYCHKKHVKQIHYNHFGFPAQVITLGIFHPENQPEQSEDQIADFSSAPQISNLQGFYKAIYTDGDLCQLDDDVGGGTVSRKAEVRLTCSQDKQNYITIDEVQQCQYVLAIFDSSFCIESPTQNTETHAEL